MRIFIKNFCRKETVLRALKVALVVGPILIIINHLDEFLAPEMSPMLILKCALTFLVPYCVSSYSSAMAYTSDEITRGE